MSDDYVAWCRYARKGEELVVDTCNSTDKGAFKVYRHDGFEAWCADENSNRLVKADSQLSAIRAALERCKADKKTRIGKYEPNWIINDRCLRDIEAILGGER